VNRPPVTALHCGALERSREEESYAGWESAMGIGLGADLYFGPCEEMWADGGVGCSGVLD